MQQLAGRSDFLDRIRVALTALVILHHAAIMFGAPGGWYLVSPTDSLAEKLPFTVFVSVNQSFFMGFFFLLSGYFAAMAYERKGPLRFARDRLLRLGIPLLVYGFVIGPMTIALAGIYGGSPFLRYWASLMREHRFNAGPLWFVWALLVFNFAYLLWRALRGRSTDAPLVPGHLTLLVAALATGIGAFLLRLLVPVGQERWMLQVGYFSSYVVLFAGGCALARARWLEQVDPAFARPWRILSWVVAPTLFIYGIAAGAIGGAPFDTSGGWNLPSLAYALWEPLVAWGIILGMLARFRKGEGSSIRWQAWAQGAYGAYIVHAPLLVGAGLAAAALPLPNIVRFVLSGLVGVGASFLAARLLLKLPGARAIL